MFKILTLVAFLSAQTIPLYTYADDPVVTEFQKSKKEMEQKTAHELDTAKAAEQIQALRSKIRDNTIVLAARMEELETLADKIPNVKDDVVEYSARALQESERSETKDDIFSVAAFTAVASGVVYALTQIDIAKWFVKTKDGPNARVKTTPVSKGLRSFYKDKQVARASSVIGVLSALVAAGIFIDNHTLSPAERYAVEGLENKYLSNLVTGGESSYLTDDQIDDLLVAKYKKEPAFRDAVVTEVQTIVADSEKLNAEILAAKDQIKTNLKEDVAEAVRR